MNSDEDFFENAFGSNFDEDFSSLDESEAFHDRVDAGLDNWERRCARVAGKDVLDAWLKAQEGLIECFLENFEPMALKAEVERRKLTGDLEEAFKKYCGVPVTNTRPCLRRFLEASQKCLGNEDDSGLTEAMKMFDAAVNFICHNNGDRLAREFRINRVKNPIKMTF